MTIFCTSVKSQSYSENFDNINTLDNDNDWFIINQSFPKGPTTWMQGNKNLFQAQDDNNSGFIAANYNSTSTNGNNNTISNWILTPNRIFRNGDTFSFYTRKSQNNSNPDRLEIRFSNNGNSVNIGDSATKVGDFKELLLSINPTLTKTDYPTTWTLYTITISNLDHPTSGRIAFRYFVTNAGLDGDNSDYIGIDTVKYTQQIVLGTNQNAIDNEIKIYPNPVKDFLFFSTKENINKVSVFSIDGKKVLEKDLNSSKFLDLKHLNQGVYFIHMDYNNKTKSFKIIKQ